MPLSLRCFAGSNASLGSGVKHGRLGHDIYGCHARDEMLGLLGTSRQRKTHPQFGGNAFGRFHTKPTGSAAMHNQTKPYCGAGGWDKPVVPCMDSAPEVWSSRLGWGNGFASRLDHLAAT